jgi:hypothetical protein
VAVSLITFFLIVLGTFAAARILRGKANYTETLRAMGFAQTIYVLSLLVLIPGLEPIVRFIVAIGALIAIWLAVSEAHGILGWRTLVLPFLAFIVLVLMFVATQLFIAGAGMTIDSLMQAFGLAQ